MTYCIAIKLQDHLVFTSDSRTNAGPDQVNVYSKMHNWGLPGHRQFVMLSAGNLATTQAVVTRLQRDIDEKSARNLLTIEYMDDVADYVGSVSVEEQARHTDTVNQGSFRSEATFLLGGQIAGQEPGIFLIYPQGNHITCSETAPFLQIGEVKYGKPILDRIIRPETTLNDAVRCSLVSMDSTMRSNVTVGPPIEVALMRRDALDCLKRYRFDEDDSYLRTLHQVWGEKLMQAFTELPQPELGDFPPCD